MNPKSTKRYECPECQTQYKIKQDALVCCPPDVNEITLWFCTECGDRYNTRASAAECCKPVDSIVPEPEPAPVDIKGIV